MKLLQFLKDYKTQMTQGIKKSVIFGQIVKELNQYTETIAVWNGQYSIQHHDHYIDIRMDDQERFIIAVIHQEDYYQRFFDNEKIYIVTEEDYKDVIQTIMSEI